MSQDRTAAHLVSPPLRASGLTVAERARTMIAGSVAVRVGVLTMAHDVSRHAVAPDGSVLFLAPPDSPTRVFTFAPGLPSQTVHLTVQDVSYVPQSDRVRGSLVLTGPLELAPENLPSELRTHLRRPRADRFDADAPVLMLKPTSISLQWNCEREDEGRAPCIDIPCEDYQEAASDALFEHEMRLLPHLDDCHRDLLRALAEEADPMLLASAQVRPLVLDRYGVVLRIYETGSYRDHRVRFDEPVGHVCDLQNQLDLLTERAESRIRDTNLGA